MKGAGEARPGPRQHAHHPSGETAAAVPARDNGHEVAGEGAAQVGGGEVQVVARRVGEEKAEAAAFHLDAPPAHVPGQAAQQFRRATAGRKVERRAGRRRRGVGRGSRRRGGSSRRAARLAGAGARGCRGREGVLAMLDGGQRPSLDQFVHQVSKAAVIGGGYA